MYIKGSVALAELFGSTQRIAIINALKGKELYISQIAEKTGMDRPTVCYHLNILEKAGIVDNEYKILEAPHSKGRAGRFYSINEKKLAVAIEEFRKLLSQSD